MKKTLLIAGALLALMAPMASAAGYINLAWGNCAAAGGALDDNFACNSNAGATPVHIMVGSFGPPMTLGKFNGHAGVVDIQTASPTLLPWWQLAYHPVAPIACRNKLAGPSDDAMSVDYNFVTGPFGCFDPWGGGASGGSGIDETAANRLRVRTVCAIGVPESLYIADPDDLPIEYYVFKIVMTNANTIGTGACAGCTDPACIVFNSLKLTQPAGVGDFIITTGPQQYVAWKHGVIGGLGCPAATPTQKATWGSVKALYR